MQAADRPDAQFGSKADISLVAGMGRKLSRQVWVEGCHYRCEITRMEAGGFESEVLAAIMGVVIFLEVWFARLFGPFHWLTLARYPRGFPAIVAIQVLTFMWLLLLAAMLALR